MPYNRSLLPNVEVLLSDMVKTSRCSTKLLFMTLNFYSWFFSSFWPNLKKNPKFQKISKFQFFSKIFQNFRISTKFQNFNQISEFWPNFIILTNFSNFHQISSFSQNLRILTKFWNSDQILEFQPNGAKRFDELIPKITFP